MEKINIIKKRNVIFIITIGIAAANLSSLIFPALIVSLSANTEIFIKNPLTPGIWAIPILIVSISILFFGIMYKTNHLPKIIYKAIKFLSDFEISKRTTFFIILITLIIYIALTIPEAQCDLPQADLHSRDLRYLLFPAFRNAIVRTAADP